MRISSRAAQNGTIWAVILFLTVAFFVFVVPKFVGVQNGGPNATLATIRGLEACLELYAVEHNGKYPVGTVEEASKALIAPGIDPRTKKPIEPYISEWPKDEWGTPLFYKYPTRKPTDQLPAIWSAGPDLRNGTNDDVIIWHWEQ